MYIGSKKGPEAEVIPKIDVAFKSVPTGKLRRYFSLENFTDLFRIPWGIFKAFTILKKYKPQVIFSKGGYVSIPVIYAAHLQKIPVILHESDVSPGLANKITAKKASILCLAYFETQQYFPRNQRKVVTGNPVREKVLKGNPENAYKITDFKKDIPVILVMGGSQGAKHLNEELSLAANELAQHYQIIHICGVGKIPEEIPILEKYRHNYQPYEYVTDQLADFYSIADLVISRAGANSLAEIEAWGIPSILIPIAKAASRGEQMKNALVFQKKYPETRVIEDELLSYRSLIQIIHQIVPYESFVKKEKEPSKSDEATKKILEVLDGYLGK